MMETTKGATKKGQANHPNHQLQQVVGETLMYNAEKNSLKFIMMLIIDVSFSNQQTAQNQLDRYQHLPPRQQLKARAQR